MYLLQLIAVRYFCFHL